MPWSPQTLPAPAPLTPPNHIGRFRYVIEFFRGGPNDEWNSRVLSGGGTALVTVPNTAVKSGGSPQKLMYLADDAFRSQGVRDHTQIVFASPAKAIFAVEKYRKTLEQVVARTGIDARSRQNLAELHPTPTRRSLSISIPTN